MTACIYYHPEAYTTSGPKLMGRNAAGESFLKGFLSYSSASEFWVQVQHPSHAKQFAQVAQQVGRQEKVFAVEQSGLGDLANPGVVYYPGPGIGEHAWHRSAYGHGSWSLCGVTHTTSSAGAMDALANLITCPVQPWDAVICTSTAVKNNVERILQAQVDYLQDRLGISKIVLPKLPIIPLGIHTKDFELEADDKLVAKKQLGIDSESLVVLFMGRLSFHAKAHPLAMYQALEIAATQTGKSIVLIECGWYANDHISKAYYEAAAIACPSVRVVTLDGREAAERRKAWSAADVFCSLSDNIQETFGIVPIEAMAAGLPVVVSDWDGYKDTVRDGIDGFRIPTIMPQPGLAGDLAFRHALHIDTYDMYCGYTCSLIGVDIKAAAHFFIALFESPELRKRMGESGRQRARTIYDWSSIIPQYESLWAHLTEIRTTLSKEIKPLKHAWPARMDPFHAFEVYATRTLKEDTLLRLTDSNAEMALIRTESLKKLAMIQFAGLMLPTESELRSVFALAQVKPVPAIMLVENIPGPRRAIVFRNLCWLIKLGVLEVCV